MISIFSVTLVTQYGMTRILFAMGRDGLLPARFATVNTRTMTPVTNTVIVATAASVLAAVVPLEKLADMVSIGTLTAFIVVSAGVIVLRVRQPDLPRGFKVPGYPVTPALSILACGYILASLHWYTWLAFSGWVSVALTYYLLRGRHHSALNDEVLRRSAEGSAVTVVVGYLAGKVGLSGLYLAVRAARTLGSSLTVATIVPKPWLTPSLARVDAEYEQWADQLAADSAKEAQRYLRKLADGIEVNYFHRAHRSVSAGLIEVVDEVQARGPGAGVAAQRSAWAGGHRLDRRLAAAFVAGAGGDQPSRIPCSRRQIDASHVRLLGDAGIG